ncbi:membrane protein [Gordonia phage MichaelScott]|uniref:Membrane protein n=1 Tax=Gordonia phage MichaelScott TaxID=2759395 RepID=A0A7L7SJ32_9CAUD|nr:membrane protein [Gordonia phage MichaelScott]QOC56306.1 membrane protein [Gordonia phage MichaelScott]
MIRRLLDTNLRRALWVTLTPIRVGIPLVGRFVMPFDYPFAGGDDQ